MFRIDIRQSAGAFTLAALAGAASAQSADPLTPTLPTVEVSDATQAPGLLPLDTPVETGSRLGLTPRETPASVTVVDRSTLEARGAQNTQEALRAIAGVTAHDAPGNIGVSYRGFSSGSIAQLFNGINVQYSIAARPVDNWIYDRVEAIGGPSSFLFGSGAVGGSINYLTKTPERSDFAEGQVRVGAYGLKEVSLGLNRRLGVSDDTPARHHARLDFNHRDAGSWVRGTETRATQLAASLLSDLGGGATHLLAYEWQHEHVDRPYWGTPLRTPAVGRLGVDPGTRFQNYNSTDGLYAQRVQWLRSVTQWQATPTLQLTNTLYAYDALRDYRNVETYRFNAANTQVARSGVLLQRHDHQAVGERLEGRQQGTLLGRRSDWAFGLDVNVNRQTRFPNSLSGTVNTTDPYDPVVERFFDIPGMAPGFHADRTNKATTAAVYLENRTALVPTLHLVTALRHERISLDLTNRRAVTAALPATFSRSYQPTTGRMGLVWDIVPGANLYAQYATAADPPSGVLSTASFADVINNSRLTSGRQAEVGGKLDFWDGKGTATLALYTITRSNIATQDPDRPGVTVLVGEQSARGAEIAVGLRPSPRWQVQANLTHVDAQYEQFVQGGVSLAGKTPTNTPATVANLWLAYALTPTLQASAGVRHVGKVYADAANTQWWPSYTLLDLGLAWKLNPTTTLSGRVRNATDRVYAANVGSQAYLGAPRTLDVALHVAF
ncbi:TonB-dependent receptor [Diaphorobacter sp.]|uniref:TonB-dependent receptor n=1 Tax=Diaphorobacter sp. TaxID=1934310 RepID=UPI00259037A3|nr:TonB-dependent receptor [Diaphorobacter sp.]